jgi:ATP-binding cassette subfamily B (MDR/TAP) protein 1
VLPVSSLARTLLILVNNKAAAYPLQSWIFAKLIDVFSFRDQKLTDAANFWSLWFFVLSLGIAACYSAVGFAANRLAIVSGYHTNYIMDLTVL